MMMEKININHSDAIQLVRGLPGQRMVASICALNTSELSWGHVPTLGYYSFGEFDLGIIEGKGCRIDSVLQVFPVGFQSEAVNIGLEIKLNKYDLEKDTKLATRYIHSGQCSYYFCVPATEALSLMACQKYRLCPEVGIVSLSGLVYKAAQRQTVDNAGRQRLNEELCRRALLPAHSEFVELYRQDKTPIVIGDYFWGPYSNRKR